MEKLFFAKIGSLTICLICGFQPTAISAYSIKRHFRTRHAEKYESYEEREKIDLIEGLKLVQQEGRVVYSEASVSEKSRLASHAISRVIAKRGKLFRDGEYVKECIIEAIKSFGNSITMEEAASIPLSAATVSSRISDIDASLEEVLAARLSTCRYFSLSLDESTDIRHTSQLSIFVRIIQNDFSYVEELLDLVPLHNAVTGAHIFDAVENTLRKFRTHFSKCSAVVTDGAKSITGTKTGLHGQFKSRGLKFPMIHCIIHQEAFCGRDIKLSSAMKKVTAVINSIRGGNKFLSHRKFSEFLRTHHASYSDIPLHCEVRWLSAAECLSKFFAIRKEIVLFLQEHPTSSSEDHISHLTDVSFLYELAFIVDLSNHLQVLNLKLQKSSLTISKLCSYVDHFRRKLVFFQRHLKENSFFLFPSCKIMLEEFGNECNFVNHFHILQSVIDEYQKRFTEFDMLRSDLTLYENPFTVKIEEQALQCQDELCSLQRDISLKSREEKGAEFFKILDESTYPNLRDFALRVLSIFGTTYLCECSFSKMRRIKSEHRSQLHDSSLSSVLRLGTSTLPVDVSDVPTPKRARKSTFPK